MLRWGGHAAIRSKLASGIGTSWKHTVEGLGFGWGGRWLNYMNGLEDNEGIVITLARRLNYIRVVDKL